MCRLDEVYVEPAEGEEGGVEVGELAAGWVDGPEAAEGRSWPGARITHFPSVCVSATRATLRPHCSRTARILFSSTQPCGTSIVRVVRVLVTTIRESSEPEIKSSVAPTDQCEGYTGVA